MPNHFKRTCVVESVIAGLFPDVAGGDVGGREVVVRLRVAHGREDGRGIPRVSSDRAISKWIKIQYV